MANTKDVVAHAAATGADLASLDAFQQLILERTHDLITITDLAGTIAYASPAWLTLGWDPAQLAGTALLDLVHPDEHDRSLVAMAEVAGGSTIDAMTVRLRTHDGGWAWFESSGSPIATAGGAAYLVATSRDVSEREELRRRVGEVDALYRIAEAIGRAASLDDLFSESVDVVVAATQADRAAVLLFDDAGSLRFRAWRGLSEDYRATADARTPWRDDDAEPEPVVAA